MNAPAYELRDVILSVRGLSRTLGGRPILRDLSFEVRDIHRAGHVTGQVVGLLGPSGVGKTVLFRLLAGLDQPDAGEVLVGHPLVPVQRGRVGVVAQHYPLFEHRTVRGNLAVAGRQAGLSWAEAAKQAAAFLDRFYLRDRADVYPAHLSGGQRQRVAIAQQFMCSEHFLLLDEPFSGLDLVAQERVCELVAEVASADTLNTLIVVTHDVVAAMAVADTIWLLGRNRDEAGRIVPGARIQATYNLIDRGLAWRKGITATPEFLALLAQIRERFATL